MSGETIATLDLSGGFTWTCACGEPVRFMIDSAAIVECSCRQVYVWGGRGFTIRRWGIQQHWRGDDLVFERVLV